MLAAVLLCGIVAVCVAMLMRGRTEGFWPHAWRWWPSYPRRYSRCGVYEGDTAYDGYCQAYSRVDSRCESGCAAHLPGLGTTCCKTSCCRHLPYVPSHHIVPPPPVYVRHSGPYFSRRRLRRRWRRPYGRRGWTQ